MVFIRFTHVNIKQGVGGCKCLPIAKMICPEIIGGCLCSSHHFPYEICWLKKMKASTVHCTQYLITNPLHGSYGY